MKKPIPLLLLVLIGCSEPEPVNYQSLVERDDLFYLQYELEPYTGKVFSNEVIDRINWDPSLNYFLDCFEGNLREGQLHGEIKFYHIESEIDSLYKPGTLLEKLRFEEGERKYIEKCTDRLSYEGNYKNGFPDGHWFKWNENGNLIDEYFYKDGGHITLEEWEEENKND